MQWTERIGRRVKLRDLHVLLAVAQAGSMARAAERLAISHPVVSKTISDLEHALGVRLLDRGPQGVELTAHGRAFMKCGTAVFDELRRGVQEIELISDPTVGEVRVGCTRPLVDGLVTAAIVKFAARYPRISIHAVDRDGPLLCDALRERRLDIAVLRTPGRSGNEDLNAEFLFDEPMFVVAGVGSPWSRRRKIDFAELLNERWVFPEFDNYLGALILENFQAAGLALPSSSAVSNSTSARARLAESGQFLTLLPGSMMYFGRERLKLKVLPALSPIKSQPTEIISLKNRSLSAVAKLFIEELHSVARPLLNGGAQALARVKAGNRPRVTSSWQRR
jgi:DNA-binding transcriptional LysR family regulator